MFSRRNDSKGKGKGKPAPDTTVNELYEAMYNSVVVGVHVEFLQMAWAANMARRQRGKRKNHVVLRFEIQTEFTYWENGDEKPCASVRASIEPDDNDTWVCSGITLKPMPNAAAASTSASASFKFGCAEQTTIAEFVRLAGELLKFEYVVVSRTVTRRQTTHYTRKSRQPRETIAEHANGCRDFTTQWWILLYQASLIGWNTIDSSVNVPGLQTGTTFDTIIGFRYSSDMRGLRVNQSRIAKAIFHSGHARMESTMVGSDLVLLPYADEFEVEEVSDNDGGDEKNKDIDEYKDKPDEGWHWGDPNEPPYSGGGGSYGDGGAYGGAGSSSQQIAGYNVSMSQY